ncbi:o-succinylbenzoate synthase [Rhodoblastus sp.]|uniref:o-succinylbenzoate synthase n=1 Tax=Rhodoblastus sp. TaxID=1962975 RepID=UPI003F9A0D71
MRLASVVLRPYALALKRPWRAASATLALRRGLLIGVEDETGRIGWGDCAPLPSSGEAGHARAFAALEQAAGFLRDLDLDAAIARLDEIADAEARWAAETALLDLSCRARGIPLRRGLNGEAVDEVAVNAALGPLDETCVARAEAARAENFRFAKIKVGVRPFADEARLLRLLAERAGPMRLRLDANRAWSESEARRFFAAVSDLPIDGVEEPLAHPTLAGLRRLQGDVPFALAVDESLFELGVEKIFSEGAVRRVVLKPARIGGISRTLRLARRAAAVGMEVVITSVVDSAIGVGAAAQLAAAIGGTQAHGLATGAWLAEDVAPPLLIQAGKLILPDGPGLGIAPCGQFAQG